MALGASRKEVMSVVLFGSLGLTAAGIALGTLGAILMSRALAGVIQDLASGDLVLYASSIAVLAGVSMVSAYVPARRATRIDPVVVALRSE